MRRRDFINRGAILLGGTIVPKFGGALADAPAPPDHAIAEGFRNVVYGYVPSAGLYAGLDVNFTQRPGHQWYPDIWYEANKYKMNADSLVYDRSDGALVIRPAAGQGDAGIESFNDINPSNSGAFYKYGYFELDCKPQNGSNFWMMSKYHVTGGNITPGNPATYTGEIDVFEGSSDPIADKSTVISTVHLSTADGERGKEYNHGTSGGWGANLPNGMRFLGERHVVGCLWTANKIAIYVDNVLINTFRGPHYYPSLAQEMGLFIGYSDNYMNHKTRNDSPREHRIYRFTVYR